MLRNTFNSIRFSTEITVELLAVFTDDNSTDQTQQWTLDVFFILGKLYSTSDMTELFLINRRKIGEY